ncbi:GNAT family N-acetyltransferase [Rhodococcoides kroppenstedtii]|uniref:GNAT family N-acetyltransferase n=1 Tax=Rhodococcoides kroppenstedtii TaxID=293050 RepID=UPI00363D0FE7
MTCSSPTVTAVHPLDDPVRSSLAGAHAPFARWVGRVARYDPEVSGFVGHPPQLDEQDWADLAVLLGPGEEVALRGGPHTPPPGWAVPSTIGLVQFDGTGLEVAPDPDALVLGPADVPEMLDLVERTRPGPFRVRTLEMGAYLGLRDGGRLIAMAGERLHPRGWTEISAVCTDPDFRGLGLATRLIRAVGHGIRARGDVPFLHTSAANHSAIRLYDTLGFHLRQRSTLTLVRTPVGS